MVKLPESRKLTGLLITMGALLILLVVAIVAVGFFGLGEGLFQAIGGYITSMGTAHQGAQMMADRSPNYPNVIPPAGGNAIPAAMPAPAPVPLAPSAVAGMPIWRRPAQLVGAMMAASGCVGMVTVTVVVATGRG